MHLRQSGIERIFGVPAQGELLAPAKKRLPITFF